MLWILVVLHVVVCFFLILVVLLQTGRGADLAGAFGMSGSQTAFGPRGASSLLSKTTTWMAVTFMLTSLTLYILNSRQSGSSIIEPTAAEAPAEAGSDAGAGTVDGGDAAAGTGTVIEQDVLFGDQIIEEELGDTPQDSGLPEQP
ncbi:MAG: preprotein translocase subunit SecG [Acidobacteriota bacterium]